MGLLVLEKKMFECCLPNEDMVIRGLKDIQSPLRAYLRPIFRCNP